MSEADTLSFVAAMLAALAVGALAYAFLFPYFSSEREKDSRVKEMMAPRSRETMLEQVGASRRKSVADTLKDMEDRQRAAEKINMRLRLQRAGLDITPRTFWLASIICGLVVASIVMLTLPASVTRIFLTVVIGLIGVFGLPRWVLNKLTARRQQKFTSELPNAIDIVVRGMKSGLPLNECVAIIGRESEEPLASEFREIIEQQRVGVSLGEALERLSMRMPLAEVKFLAIVIAIQQQAGGNLSEALSNLSGVLRDRFRLKMKVKALSAEAKASAIVLASLPPVVMFLVYMTSPEYIVTLFNTRAGNFALVICGMWMAIGTLTMRKMINFKF